MLKMIKNYFITILTILCAQTTDAHIFNVQKLIKGDHSIILLGDNHTTLNAEKERTAIIDCAKNCGGAIIVEDSSVQTKYDVTKQIDGCLCQWPIRKHELDSVQEMSTVYKLYSSAIHEGIAASNVEFRFPRKLTLKNMFKVIEQKIKRIKTTDYGASYNAYFKKMLEYVENYFEKPYAALFQKLRSSDKTIHEFLKSESMPITEKDTAHMKTIMSDRGYYASIETGTDIIELLYSDYRDTILEMEIACSIAEYDNYRTVFVCAGAMHTAQISRMLQELGYTLQKQIGLHLEILTDPSGQEKTCNVDLNLEMALPILCIGNEPVQMDLIAPLRRLAARLLRVISEVSTFFNRL